MELETTSLRYVYYNSDFPEEAEQVLTFLEDEFGGKRSRLYVCSGSNEVILQVFPAIAVVISLINTPLATKYLNGLLNGDIAKDLGAKHREALLSLKSWILSSKLKTEISAIVAVTNNLIEEYPKSVVCYRKKTDFILKVEVLDKLILTVVLNKEYTSDVRAKIPASIIKALGYMVENQASSGMKNFKLIYDYSLKEWCLESTKVTRLSKEK